MAYRQCSAFLRISSSAKFIQQHQAVGVGFFQDVDDIGNMPGKGGQGLFDGLFVTDIGKDLFEYADLGTEICRMCKPDLAMRANKPTVFSVTVLPPVSGPVMTRMK